MKTDFLPIFVVGNSRSGTTLMGRILGNHPDIFTFEELHFFEELWNPSETIENYEAKQAIKLTSRLLNIQRNGYLTQKNSEDFLEEAETIVNQIEYISPQSVFQTFLTYEAQLNNKKIPCEQTPRNVLYISEILEIYPKARIINMIRDPRDVLLSQKQRWKRPFLSKNIPKKEAIRYWINYHPITISKLWNTNIATAKKFQEHPNIYTLRFEDLLFNPKHIVQEICDFLSIDFQENLLLVPKVGSSYDIDQLEQKEIDSTKAYNWRKGELNSTEIFLCQKINKPLMEKYNYSLEKVKVNPILLFLSFCIFPFKLFLALIFSFKRIRNLSDTIRRRLL